MSSYRTKDGSVHSHYCTIRAEMEYIGREVAVEFWQSRGGVIVDADKIHGKVNYDLADFLVSVNQEMFEIEPEVKSNRDWKYIPMGIHIPHRKGDYVLNARVPLTNWFHFMVKEDRSEIVVTNASVLKLAFEHPGVKGIGRIASSPDFIVPIHGCCTVSKWCRQRNNKWEEDTFLEIPIKYTDRYNLDVDTKAYVLHQKAEPVQ